MKRMVLSKYILSVLFLLAFLTSLAQQSQPPKQDDEFSIFLLVLASIFMCAMMGAAIIGAMAASLAVFALFGLTALGVLSASVAVGLYKRSVAAGFKTFLAIVFATTGGILGIAGSFLASRFLEIPVSGSTLIGLAGAGGVVGGMLMAFATYKVVQALLQSLAKRFHTA